MVQMLEIVLTWVLLYGFHFTDIFCGMDHVCRARDLCAPNMYAEYSGNIDQTDIKSIL
jgi:hypothetical protein